MKKICYNPTTLATPVGHFDRAVRFGDWLYISGTSALTNVSGNIKDRRLVKGIEAQTRETLDNIERVLKAAGGTLEQIYEVRIIMKRAADYPVVDRIFAERIPKKGFIAHGYEGILVHPEMELEVEANAYLGPLDGVERVGRS
jgi:enamine deaminase RidA (YjgF/YER057c/UK114 family)